ncbi:MAG: winged helix DNA-binding domain-containing protein [Candidatus Nanopelagicales bacterium]
MASLLLDDQPGGQRSIPEVVEWFAAMQGQDLASLQWSLGLRTGTNRAEVIRAFDSGRILRTWPMRGTLHVVPGRDVHWMLEHLGARALAGAARRREILDLTAADADRAADVLGTALAGGTVLTRAECVEVLESAGIPGAGQRAYHLLWYASQKGVTCLGPPRGKEQTFVLLDDFAPPGPGLDRPAALAEIAARFVRSHGPVSAHDLARWADLTLTDARAALASAEGLTTLDFEGRTLHVTEQQRDTHPDESIDPMDRLPARALPGFDEFILGYRDRTAQLDAEHERLVVPGGNGVFANTLVLDGRVVGTWRRRELVRSVEIAAAPFARLGLRAQQDLEPALRSYGEFVGKPARVTWSDPAG